MPKNPRLYPATSSRVIVRSRRAVPIVAPSRGRARALKTAFSALLPISIYMENHLHWKTIYTGKVSTLDFLLQSTAQIAQKVLDEYHVLPKF